MEKRILATRFDLPFYLRLPPSGFFTWDPEFTIAAILPCPNVGQVSFSKSTTLIDPAQLLNQTCAPRENTSDHKVLMTCQTEDYGEVPTLHIDNAATGGFSELRTYTEVNIFIVTTESDDARLAVSKARSFEVLNHFIDIYRLVTQDPYVYRVGEEFDTYLVDYCLGSHTPRTRKELGRRYFEPHQ